MIDDLLSFVLVNLYSTQPWKTVELCSSQIPSASGKQKLFLHCSTYIYSSQSLCTDKGYINNENISYGKNQMINHTRRNKTMKDKINQ